MKKILIIEDDAAICKTLKDFLQHADLDVVCEQRGDQALDVFAYEKPDLIILDLNLPGMDGLDICKQIRTESAVPIIMLTARREELDQIRGLDIGADDYITKPFSPKVLVRKVKKMLERPPLDDPEIIRFKDIELDLAKYTATQKDKLLDLTPLEFNLLKTLIQKPHQAFSRDRLIDLVYDETLPPDIFDRTIDSHVKNLRKKLGKGDYIKTVRGVGYQAKEDG